MSNAQIPNDQRPIPCRPAGGSTLFIRTWSMIGHWGLVIEASGSVPADHFHELVGVKRLGQVVDRPAVEALLAGFRAVEGRQDDDDGDGPAGGLGLGADAAADFE